MVTLNTKSTKMGGSSDGIEHGHGLYVHRLDYSKHYSSTCLSPLISRKTKIIS